MCRRLVETVAVRLGLGGGHHLAQLRSARACPATAACEHLALEQEAGADVDDHLVRAHEVDVELGQALGALEAGEAGFDDERLAEDAGRLGERHRELTLQGRATGQRRVVVGVAEFVGGGLGRVGRARPVEQHQ